MERLGDSVEVSAKIISPEQFQARFNQTCQVIRDQGMPVILSGSLARAAALGDPIAPVSVTGRMRDFDMLAPTGTSSERIAQVKEEMERVASPVLVDYASEPYSLDGEAASIRYKKIEVPVDPDVFKLYERKFFGEDVLTYDANTLLHLTLLSVGMRHKDFRQIMQFAHRLKSSPGLVGENDLKPFHELAKRKRTEYPVDYFLNKVRWQYHKKVPEAVRHKLNPVVGKAFRRVIK